LTINDIGAKLKCYNSIGRNISNRHVDFIDEIDLKKLDFDKVKSTCVQLRINIAQNFDDPLEAFVSIM